ncbi:MAG TPA: MATE family efflux transporter [Phycisphaerae bacterium]|nr:MATE family efflux transporter [Phycisphaerae bacterium]
MPDVVDEAGAMELPVAETLEYAPSAREELLRRSTSSALMWLALPVLGEQVLNLMVGMTDFYLAGTIGKEATAALGLGITVAWLIGLLFSFVGAGATALVSRFTGRGDMKGANHFANQAIVASALMGLVCLTLVQLAAPLLPPLLGWESEPARMALTYLRVDAIGYLLMSVSAISFACLRGAGDTRAPLYVMAVVNIVNVVVSMALRFGWGPIPELGFVGIVTGTVVARTLGGLMVIRMLIRGRSGLRLRAGELRFRGESLARLFRIGLPAGIDGILMWTANFVFVAIISQLGSGETQAAIVAAHFVGIRIEALSYLPAWAWATAAATMVGQSLGAGRPDRARHSAHLAALHGAGLCTLMGILYFVFAEPIFAIFNSSGDMSAVSAVGVPALRMLACFQIPLALMIIYPNALRGAGDTRHPMLFTALSMFGLRIPLAYLFGVVLDGGLIGAWVGMCADMTLRAILNGLWFTLGRWQQVRV